MRFTAPQTPAKLSELIEAKGAESIEVLVAAMLSEFGLARHLHE